MQRGCNTNGSGEMSEEGDEWMKSMYECVRVYVRARSNLREIERERGERARERGRSTCMCVCVLAGGRDAECLAAVDR